MKNDINKHSIQLQDFVRILADRIEIYTKIIASLNRDSDTDLIAIVEKYMQLSQQFKSELLAILPKEDTLPPEKTQTTGDMYTLWQEEKPKVEGIEQQKALDIWKGMEATVLRALQQLLSAKNNFTEDTEAILKSQLEVQRDLYEQLISIKK